MANPIIPGAPNPPGGSQPSGPNPAATKAIAQEVGKLTDVLEKNTDAMSKWGRMTADEEKLQKSFRTELKKDWEAVQEYTKSIATLRGQYGQLKEAVKGYAGSFEKMITVSAIYERKLEMLQKGTEAYSTSLQANTANISQAAAASGKYVKAVTAAAAESKVLAAQYNMDSAKIKDATMDMAGTFSTQLGAMGDVSGGLKSLQKDMVIYSRFLGMDMKDVVGMWNERLSHSTMTLRETKKETAVIAKITDEYSNSISKMTKRMQESAQIGRAQFVAMLRDIGKEFKTGIFDATSYGKVMKDLLLMSKGEHRTKAEQEMLVKGMGDVMADAQTMQGEIGVMGARGIETVWQKFKTAPETMEKATRERLAAQEERITKQGGIGSFGGRKLAMEAARGSKEFSLAVTDQMKQSTSPEVLANILADKFGGVTNASEFVDMINKGTFADNFAKANEEEQKAADAAKNDMDKMLQAAAKTDDWQNQSIRKLEQIKAGIEKLIWVTGAGALLGPAIGSGLKYLGGAALMKLAPSWAAKLGIGAATSAGGSTLAGGAAVGAGTAATGAAVLPGAAGFIGPVAPTFMAGAGGTALAATVGIPMAAAAGVVAGTLINRYAGKVGMSKGEKKYFGDDDATLLSDRIGLKMAKWSLGEGMGGRAIQGVKKLFGGGQSDADRKEALDTLNNTTRVSYEEFLKRKEMVKQLDLRVRELTSYGNAITLAQRDELEAKKKLKAKIEKSIEGTYERTPEDIEKIQKEWDKGTSDRLQENISRAIGSKDLLSQKDLQSTAFALLQRTKGVATDANYLGELNKGITGSTALRGHVGGEENIEYLRQEVRKQLVQRGFGQEAVEAELRGKEDNEPTTVGMSAEQKKELAQVGGSGGKLRLEVAGQDGAVDTIANVGDELTIPFGIKIKGTAFAQQIADIQHRASRG